MLFDKNNSWSSDAFSEFSSGKFNFHQPLEIYFHPPPFNRDRQLEQIYNEIAALKSTDLPELSDRVRDFNRSCEHRFADINSAVVANTPHSVNDEESGWESSRAAFEL